MSMYPQSFASPSAVRPGHKVGQGPSCTPIPNGQAMRLREVGRARGFRSVLCVPMLRDGTVIGAITVTRAEPGIIRR